MLKNSMKRFLLPFLLPLALGLTAHNAAVAQANVVAHGLIIQLKPGAQSEFSRELPSAAHAQRESLAQERMAAVAQGSGVKDFSHRLLSGDHRLMRFAKPLQGSGLEDTMRRLRLHPDVAFVEPNVRVQLAQVPNDTQFPLQWHLGTRNGAAAALSMSSTWAITTGTSAITVAVLDTGVLRNHPDLQAMGSRLLQGYDFVEDVDSSNDGDGRDADASDPGDYVDDNDLRNPVFAGCLRENSSWHGSFITGQIAAETNNGLGVAGLNWNAKILPVRVFGKCGAVLSDILDGMRWAAGLSVAGAPVNTNPARVMNLSFGGGQACTSSYQTVIDEVTALGVLVVVAAGNGSGAQSRQLRRPADCRGVMAVGAVQRDGAKTGYSFVGSNMALMAPGGNESAARANTLLLSTDNAGTTSPGELVYGYKAGTSFSAPLAAGVASLMLAVNPSLSPDALIARMQTSALPHISSGSYVSCTSNNTVACNCNTALCGAGLLNPLGAVQESIKPAAVIAAVGSPSLGATVVLDARASSALDTATIASYAWSQVSGPVVSLPNASASVTQVVLPGSAGTFVFQLSVTDSQGRSGQSQLAITTVAPAPAVSSVAGSGSGGGGGGGADHGLWLALLAVLVGAASTRFLMKNKQ
jgi:serine protease